MVRAGNFTDADRPNDSHVAFSTDGGANWFQGTGAGRRQQRRHGRRGGRRQPVRLGAAATPAPVSTRSASATRGRRPPGVPADAMVESDRVNPKKFYGFSGGTFYVSTNGGADASPRPRRPACRRDRRQVQGGRRAARATSGWPASDAGCATRPTPAPSFTKLAAVTGGDQRRLRQGGARADVPGALPRRHGRRRDRRVPLRQRRRDLGADQRRRAPVRQHGRGAHR